MDIDNLLVEVLKLQHRIAYALLSPQLILESFSPGFWQMLGKSGPPPRDLRVPKVLDEFVGMNEILQEILDGKRENLIIENVNYGSTMAEPRYITFAVFPLDDTQPAKGLFLILEDVTQASRLRQQLIHDRNDLRLARLDLERANQQLEHLSQYKSMILSFAAHDLRNPLAVISMYADLAKSHLPEDSPASVIETLDLIIYQCASMDYLINDLLDAEQIQLGKLEIQPVQCNLNSQVRTLIRAAELADKNHHDYELNISQEDLLVFIDPAHLDRILHNLFSNAAKYTPRDGIVRVITYQQDRQAVIEVSNTGSGIDPDELSDLFSLYFRSSKALQQKIKGRGLGLYIVKSLAEAHEGRVEVASVPGEWTTFRVYLPNA